MVQIRMAALALIIATVGIPKLAAAGAEYVGQAVVTDGDTIEIHGQRIRLWGIDAIEGAQRCWDASGELHQCGKYAANALADFIGRKVVRCDQIDMDYKRPVARCFVGETDMGEWMVNQGWAIDFVRYSKGYYSKAQDAARSEARGNWKFNWPYPANYRSCMHTRGGNVVMCSQQR